MKNRVMAEAALGTAIKLPAVMKSALMLQPAACSAAQRFTSAVASSAITAADSLRMGQERDVAW